MPTYERRPTNEQQPHNTHPWNRGLPVGCDQHLRCHGTHIGGQIPTTYVSQTSWSYPMVITLREDGPTRWFEPFGRVREERKPKDGVLQLVGRDTETSAQVRYDAYPPSWSKRKGPSEYAHWLLHTEQSGPYELGR